MIVHHFKIREKGLFLYQIRRGGLLRPVCKLPVRLSFRREQQPRGQYRQQQRRDQSQQAAAVSLSLFGFHASPSLFRFCPYNV